MARVTSVDNILFDVWKEKIYLAGRRTPIAKYQAIVGKDTPNSIRVFSIVSDNYHLLTNKEAIELGKKLHLKLFPGAKAESFEIFNVLTPLTKSFCHIDIIDKNYTLNIMKSEVYVPFVRIHNSYNKSRSLKFDIGFVRRLCNNGVIFEEKAVSLKFAHTKQALKLNGLEHINVSHLKKYEEDFVLKLNICAELALPRKYFQPMAAKVLKKEFKLDSKDIKKNEEIGIKLDAFVTDINRLSEKYIITEKQGETAYAFYNVVTDYASNSERISIGSINGLQAKCGKWISQIKSISENKKFRWDDEVCDYEYLIG